MTTNEAGSGDAVSGGRARCLVVGLDGGDEAAAALAWAARIVADGGKIHAVRALRPGEELAAAALQIDTTEALEARRQELDEWVAGVRRAGTDVVAHVVEDDPADALLAVADEVDADVVVVGVHARARLSLRTLGRVTAKLIETTQRPVAVVAPSPDLPLGEGSTVVAGVGRGRATEAALRWAIDFAATRGTSLSLVHAIPHRPIFGTDGLLDVLAFYVDTSLLHDWALEDLAEMAADLQRSTEDDVPITWSSADGRPGPAIVEAGADAALLVIGRHDDRRLARHTIAPTLHHVLTHAPCPVIVVPSGGDTGDTGDTGDG